MLDALIWVGTFIGLVIPGGLLMDWIADRRRGGGAV